MANTLPDISVKSEDWTDLSDVSGIPAGTQYLITNKPTVWAMLVESDTKPETDYTNGVLLANFPSEMSSAVVTGGSKKVWAKARPTGVYKTATLNLQEM